MPPANDDNAIQPLVNNLVALCSSERISLPEAARKLRSYGWPKADVDLAAARVVELQRANLVLDESVTSDAVRVGPWYAKPLVDGVWSAYREHWVAAGKPGVDYLDSSTTHITALLADPKTVGTRKGLVMGNVQSGKTGNYAGVIAKAVDAGYRVIIVLAGLYNNLRQQTQARLVHDVFASNWELLTGKDTDLASIDYPQRSFNAGHVTAAVVKKNPKRLRNLLEGLKALDDATRERLPILIIDDEADQATPNSPTAKKAISTINGLMREIWQEVRVGTYLAYTATPFANMLMDPDEVNELFPDDFITTIEPGPTYFGPERVFGAAEAVEEGKQTYSDGLDMVRPVPESEVEALRPPSGKDERKAAPAEVVPSLQRALRWFLVATAIRRLRGDSGHSSMLVHTTHYADPHMAMRDAINEWLQVQRRTLDEAVYRDLWEAESHRVPLESEQATLSWENIWRQLRHCLEEMKVVVDNGLSDDRLDFTNGPQTVVAVGGGTLSRGLTLEGLVVSFFTRSTNTYDTLMQMGRWFGYRDGYEDLPRIWVSEGLDKDYAFLARVERDLREEIKSLEGSEFTPRQVGVKIRCHPGRLEVTSVGRMKQAKLVNVSLSGTLRQSFILDGSREVQARNRLTVERLIGSSPEVDQRRRLVKRNVRSAHISQFLNSFTSHPDQSILNSPEQRNAMTKWLDEYGSGCAWTVMVNNNTDAEHLAEESYTICGHSVAMSQRAPLKDSHPGRLDFKAVMSPSDWLADIEGVIPHDGTPSTLSARQRARREHAHGQGLLLIYVLSPNAKAKLGSKSRRDMPVTNPVLAFSIIFPNVDDPSGDEATFIGVRTNPYAVVDEEDLDEDLPEDTEDALVEAGNDD